MLIILIINLKLKFMCCSSNSKPSSCGCNSHVMYHPEFWSKKKKISVMENYLSNIEEKANEVREALKEMKEEE